MGCRFHLIVNGGSQALLDDAVASLADLERRWTRFRDDSEIAALNAGAGSPVPVSGLTVVLVERAIEAWTVTGGRFDPTVLPALLAAGYDRTFAEVASSPHPAGAARPAPGCAEITVDRMASTVTFPSGVGFDAGGIGKGLAADLLVEDLATAGVDGVSINLGGDVRVWGESIDQGGAWSVGVEDPFLPDQTIAHLRLVEGAVATSSRMYRVWERAGASHHHLIDPATGESAWTDLAAVTVVAAEAAWAEVLAKAAFVSGLAEGTDLVVQSGATGLSVDDGGDVHPFPGIEELLTWASWR